MKVSLPAFSGSLKNTIEEAAIRKNSESPADPRKGIAHGDGAGNLSTVDLEKDLYALMELCVTLLEMDAKRKEIGRMRREFQDVGALMATRLKKEAIALRKIISLTQQRLRSANP